MNDIEQAIWHQDDDQTLGDYPTNVHRILKIKRGQRFMVKNTDGQYVLTNLGLACTVMGTPMPQYFLSSLINFPESIIPISIVTEDQRGLLEAGLRLGMIYIALDKDGKAEMYDELPIKGPSAWYLDGLGSGRSVELPNGHNFSAFLSWQDKEPSLIRSLTGQYSNIPGIDQSQLKEQGVQ